MSVVTATAIEVTDKIRSLATAQPHHVYVPPVKNLGGPTCWYVHNSSDGLVGGCIVGQALLAVDVPAEDLHEYDLGDGANGSQVVRRYTGNLTVEQQQWIDSVQQQQDSGKTWGEAVEHADKFYPLS